MRFNEDTKVNTRAVLRLRKLVSVFVVIRRPPKR